MNDSCREIRAMLPGLQGPTAELDPQEAARVRTHVAGCPACHAEWENTLAVGRLVAALATADTPVPTLDPVGLAVRLARPRYAGWVAAVPLAVLLVAGVGWVVFFRPADPLPDPADYWIGAVVVSLPDGSAEVPAGVPLDPPGYYVARILDGPARDGGVRVGDRIVAVDGESVSGSPIRVLPTVYRKGDPVELTVLRGGQRLSLLVRPVPRPSGSPAVR